eukprot:CAMPEP_0194693716 /NCGR_PEP_ID=MMETSP0295-20121207/20742_1 /TAXON_ID=39354 /ORGANISM="Heterosigma akashiwo, Strain CCMP2393" /LENGTH=125 /DNA_ID=CAMNT_0039584741 /DNA_START=14 /DNA_END=392 /DNA_ORIENTATION=-
MGGGAGMHGLARGGGADRARPLFRSPAAHRRPPPEHRNRWDPAGKRWARPGNGGSGGGGGGGERHMLSNEVLLKKQLDRFYGMDDATEALPFGAFGGEVVCPMTSFIKAMCHLLIAKVAWWGKVI